MKLSNVRKKKKGNHQMWQKNCHKRIVTCDVGITQCENKTVKCEKKVRKPSNVTKIEQMWC